MIFTYTFRSILAQRTVSLVSIGVLATMTAVAVVLLGFVHSLIACLLGAGDLRTAVVITDGATESSGRVTMTAGNRIELLDEVVRENGQSLASREAVALLPLTGENGQIDDVSVRGLTQAGLAVHDRVRIHGRFPAPGEPGVVIGASLIGRHEGFVEGGRIRFGRNEWPVLGTLSARDSPFESELWCDRTFLKQTLHRTDDSSVYVKLTSPAAQASFASGVAAMRSDNLRAFSEPEYYKFQLKEIAIYFDFVYFILFVLVSSMVLASANTIYTSFLGRTRELATLMAIGFSRRRVMLMMTFESVLLTLIGACLGMLVSLAAHGHRIVIDELAFVSAIRISPQVLGIGLLIGLLTGLIAGVVANVQIARIDVLRGLRN